jgi:membrane protein required for colicin V production
MNYLDIIIAVLILIFGIAGWRKGIIIEVTTLLALGLGLYGAFHFSDFTAVHLIEFVEIDPKYLNLISFIVTFIIVSLLVHLLGRMVARLIKNLNLGFIDRIGGFIVGLAKGLLLCSLLVMLLNVMNTRGILKDDLKKGSLLYPYVEATVPYVYQGFDLVREAVQKTDTSSFVEDFVDQNGVDASFFHA